MPKPKDWRGDKWNGRKPGYINGMKFKIPLIIIKNLKKKDNLFRILFKTRIMRYDSNGNFYNQRCIIIPLDDLYLLGILNCNL